MRHLFPLVLSLAACSTLNYARTAKDYDARDKQTVKKIVVATSAYGEGPGQGAPEAVQRMVNRMALRYVHLKRNFIPVGTTAAALSQSCGQEGVAGTLQVKAGGAEQKNNARRVIVQASLLRCDGTEVWAAEGTSAYDVVDTQLPEQIELYAREFGEEVRPWVAPLFRQLRKVVDSMPNPELNEADLDEKVAVDE